MNGRQKRTPKVDSDKGSRAEFNAKKKEKLEDNKVQRVKAQKEKAIAQKKRKKEKPSFHKNC